MAMVTFGEDYLKELNFSVDKMNLLSAKLPNIQPNSILDVSFCQIKSNKIKS